MLLALYATFIILVACWRPILQSMLTPLRKKGQESATGITLSSPSDATMEKVCEAINREAQDVVTKATMPILDRRDPCWRALMAVAIECNQCVGGVPGSNIITIYDWLNSPTDDDKEKQPHQFLEFLVQSKNCQYTIEGLSACAQAVFFEPGNVDGQIESSFQYLHCEPKVGKLYAYCKDFASSEIMMSENGPEICLCCGPNEEGEHLFLKEDGSRV
jgi:hypothetical protein